MPNISADDSLANRSDDAILAMLEAAGVEHGVTLHLRFYLFGGAYSGMPTI
jgi:hypothetical protein